MGRPRPTLAQAAFVGLAAVGLTIGLLFQGLHDSSRTAILASGERIRMEVSERIGGRVEDYLRGAQDALASLERQAVGGVLDLSSPESVSKGLITQLMERPGLAEVTFTAASGVAGHGWQVAAIHGEGGVIRERRVQYRSGRFTARLQSADGQVVERNVTDPDATSDFSGPGACRPERAGDLDRSSLLGARGGREARRGHGHEGRLRCRWPTCRCVPGGPARRAD